MSDTIEISNTSAKRLSTGSKFRMNLVPLEFAGHECWYEHPQFNVEVGFHAKWVFDKRTIPRGTQVIQRSVGLGMIVIQDELHTLITGAAEKRGLELDAQALVLDCYELIVAFLRDRNERGSFSDQPHIYLVTAQEYGELGSSAEVGPGFLKEICAIEVY